MLSYIMSREGAGEIERLPPPQLMPVRPLSGVLAGRLHCFRLAEIDLLGAHRFDSKKRDVPGLMIECCENLACRIVGSHLKC